MFFIKKLFLGLAAVVLIYLGGSGTQSSNMLFQGGGFIGIIVGLVVLYIFGKMVWRAMGCLPVLLIISLIVGFILYAIGSAICWMFPTNMVIMLAGQFIKNMGGLPSAYVFMALFADVLDHVEWRFGFRCDGIAMSVYNIISVAMVGICTGVFNGLLAKSGYIAPEIVNGVTVAAEQTAAVKGAITFGFVGLEAITGIILAVLLIFLNVEKNIDKEQAEIKARREAEE